MQCFDRQKSETALALDLAFEHTEQALIFGVAPIPYDSRMFKSLAAFALEESILSRDRVFAQPGRKPCRGNTEL